MGKKVIFAICIFLCVFGTMVVHAGPSIQPVDEPWEFGSVEKGEIKEKTFFLVNNGDSELVLDKVNTCCGYGVKVIAPWEIPPGEKSELILTIDSSLKSPGKDEKYVTIITNDPLQGKLNIAITANITEGPEGNKVFVPEIRVGDLNGLINKKQGMFIVDVRERTEFQEKHIEGSENFPRSGMISWRDLAERIEENNASDKKIPVLCGTGARSSYLARKLQEQGYDAYNVAGGVSAWDKAGFPLVRGEKAPQASDLLVIDLEEAYDHYFALFGPKVVWVDVRDVDEYGEGHIEGAQNIPLDEFGEELSSLPKDKCIVLYCGGLECGESKVAGEMLLANGFKQAKVRVYKGGFALWEQAGYPIE